MWVPQLNLSMYGVGMRWENLFNWITQDPGFVSCSWETSALMFDIGLRHLSDLWQGRERRGLHLGDCPTFPLQQGEGCMTSVCGQDIDQRESYGSLIFKTCPRKQGETLWYGSLEDWVLRPGTDRGMGCSLYPRELAPGEISEARVSCNLKEQSPWDQPGKSFTTPASPLRGAKALLNKLGIKEWKEKEAH